MALSPANSHGSGYPLGLTGATAATRYVGGTTTGAPASGTFAVGDFVVAEDGTMQVCTVAGSPGTWVAVSGGGAGAMTQVAASVLGSAGTFDFTNIAGTYSHLLLIMQLRTTANNGANANLNLNADAGANYYRAKINNTNATVSGTSGVAETSAGLDSAALPGNTDTAGRAGGIRVWLPNYAGTTFHKEIMAEYHTSISAVVAGQSLGTSQVTWANTAAITEVAVTPSAGATFMTGSGAWLYGIT